MEYNRIKTHSFKSKTDSGISAKYYVEKWQSDYGENFCRIYQVYLIPKSEYYDFANFKIIREICGKLYVVKETSIKEISLNTIFKLFHEIQDEVAFAYKSI